MSSSEIYAIYVSLKESGDLQDLYPHLTGVWEVDKPSFTALYKENEVSLDRTIDIFGEDEYFDDDLFI